MFASNTSQVSSDATYIEDVFSTYLYTGNGSTQTITNGIDLSTYDGLVWCKNRAQVSSHELSITRSDLPRILRSNATDASQQGDISGFHSAGFFLQNVVGNINQNGQPCVSWTFRKQPKFFDVVTYTGNDTTQVISHNLGSTPGCIIIKRTDNTSDWPVWHRNDGVTPSVTRLNGTNASINQGQFGSVTSTTFEVINTGSSYSSNFAGATYVAYLFAHDAGGFGLTGTDNVISCGSFTTDGSGLATVTLGYEPQWVLVKKTNASENWQMLDVMRGMSYSDGNKLFPNTSGAEAQLGSNTMWPLATGFGTYLGLSSTYIYIAIRRGPMKTPESGTEVFAPLFQTSGSTATSPSFPTGFVTDMLLRATRAGGTPTYPAMIDRLRGSSPYLVTSSTAAEGASTTWKYDSMTGVYRASSTATTDIIGWNFRRAPGFFDVVCYTGNNSATTINHNLGVAPQLMLVKRRNSTGGWFGYADALGNTKYLLLNSTAAAATSAALWNSTSPTASVFSLGADSANISGATYVAYLFASCPGVSKVGSYTGTGSTQTINCGFASGARFVLIKCTSNLGNWYIWDTARGMVSGTDPFLWLNSTNAENSGTDVYTATGGFQINTSDAEVNGSGSTYIYLAIA